MPVFHSFFPRCNGIPKLRNPLEENAPSSGLVWHKKIPEPKGTGILIFHVRRLSGNTQHFGHFLTDFCGRIHNMDTALAHDFLFG